MFQRNIFKILLLCMALAQLSLAYIDYYDDANLKCRFPDNYVLREPSEKDKNLPATVQLEKFIVENVANFYFKFNEKLKAICNAAIRDLAGLPNGKYLAEEIKNKTRMYEQKYAPCKTIPRDKVMVFICQEVIDSYRIDSIYLNHNNNTELVTKVLRKYDAFNYSNLVPKEIEQFVANFEQKFKDLRHAIKQENLLLGKKLDTWYGEEYKLERNDYNRASLISNFIYNDFFADSNEDVNTRRNAIKYDFF